MKNDIIRKLTSLTLMSIMVAGGLTFAIPGALPQAAAESATSGTLTVSTTEFGGQQILEITVNDPDYRALDSTHIQPQVTIDGENVQMIQASNGVWYAYVADENAVRDGGIAGFITDNAVTGTLTSVSNPGDLVDITLQGEQIPAGLSNPSGVSATSDNWPYLQLHEFDNDGDTLDVTYLTEKISVTYDDDLAASSSVAFDRTDVPEGATVHISISDTRLNLDPTGADVWRLNTADNSVQYMVGDTATDTTLNEEHGTLDIPSELTHPDTLRFEETSANSGVFVSYDSNDESPITLNDSALLNAEVEVTYADANSGSLFVTDTDPTISITSDGTWSPGEKAVVTLNAPNLDTNTLVADDLEIADDPLPLIETGTPFTIVTLDTDTIFNTTRDMTSKLLRFNAANASTTEIIIPFNKTDIASGDFYYVHASDEIALQNATLTDDPNDAEDAVNGTALSGVIADDGLPDDLQIVVTPPAAVGDDPAGFERGDALVFDILSFGGSGNNVANNAIYRHLLEETDNGVFTGTIEYILLNQVSIAEAGTYEDIETEDPALVIVMVDDNDDAEISYQLDAVRAATATVTPLTTTGEVSFDSDRYSTNGEVTVTLIDPDLTGGRYTLDQDGTVRSSTSDSALLNFYIDDIPWVDCRPSVAEEGEADNYYGLGMPDALTLEESTPGTFTATFALPDKYCTGVSIVDGQVNDIGRPAPVTGKSIKVTYTDFRDETGIASSWSDSATIQAVTGSISLDRNVYPIPSPAIGTGDQAIIQKDVVLHIEINDADFNTDSAVINEISTDQVTITITPVSEATATDISGTELQREFDRIEAIDVDDRTAAEKDRILAIPGETGEKQAARDRIGLDDTFGETDVDTGIFSATVEIPYNVLSVGKDTNPIEQSYILSVTYTDSSDATGQSSDVTDSAIFNIGTATLSVDATEYAIEQKAFVTLVDYDRNYDSDTREMIERFEIVWEGSAESDLSGDEFDASPPFLRETEANSGIFLTEITIPEFVSDRGEEKVNLGETVTLTYTDHSPAGADRPAENDRDIETSFTISRTGASLTLDKDVYSWRDRVTITVVAPDFNIDALAIESIGGGDVNIRSQLDEKEDTMLTETGPNTGIFQGTVDLGGFEYDVASGITVQPANMLQVANEDGVSITFTYDEDERDLIQSALIRWNVAEVSWFEDSYREGSTGTLRVVDPDRNIHPDTPDSIETIVFSDTYRGGIKIALTETEPSSGVFEGEVIFDVLHSEGNRLQISEGDIVTAAYDDRTLPPPDGEGDRLRVTGTTTVGSIVPPLERVEVSNLGVVDALNNPVDSVSVGQQVNIAADLTSAQSRSQDYAYLLQIQNADGVTVHLSWAASSLAGFGGANVSQSWTPDETGSYTATVFVWESLTNPTALSPQNSIDIAVV